MNKKLKLAGIAAALMFSVILGLNGCGGKTLTGRVVDESGYKTVAHNEYDYIDPESYKQNVKKYYIDVCLEEFKNEEITVNQLIDRIDTLFSYISSQKSKLWSGDGEKGMVAELFHYYDEQLNNIANEKNLGIR